jgi:hypothetical protein
MKEVSDCYFSIQHAFYAFSIVSAFTIDFCPQCGQTAHGPSSPTQEFPTLNA